MTQTLREQVRERLAYLATHDGRQVVREWQNELATLEWKHAAGTLSFREYAARRVVIVAALASVH